MAVLGGFRTFTGPIIGAVVFNYLKTYAVAGSEYWQLLLGVVLVILVMVLPSGIVGVFRQPPAWLRKGATNPVSFAAHYFALLLVAPAIAAGLQLVMTGHARGFIAVLAVFVTIISWFLLVGLAYLRGEAVGRPWLWILALLALVSGPALVTFVPLLHIVGIVLVSVVLHVACVLLAVRGAKSDLVARNA
jgi:hypothetical protein